MVSIVEAVELEKTSSWAGYTALSEFKQGRSNLTYVNASVFKHFALPISKVIPFFAKKAQTVPQLKRDFLWAKEMVINTPEVSKCINGLVDFIITKFGWSDNNNNNSDNNNSNSGDSGDENDKRGRILHVLYSWISLLFDSSVKVILRKVGGEVQRSTGGTSEKTVREVNEVKRKKKSKSQYHTPRKGTTGDNIMNLKINEQLNQQQQQSKNQTKNNKKNQKQNSNQRNNNNKRTSSSSSQNNQQQPQNKKIKQNKNTKQNKTKTKQINLEISRKRKKEFSEENENSNKKQKT